MPKKNNQLICFDGEKPTFVYNIIEDKNLEHNLIEDSEVNFQSNEMYLKGYLHMYSKALIDNKMTRESWSNSRE